MDKEIKALQLIEKALNEHDKPFISCSFGKDSIVIMDMVLRIDKNIPVVWSRTGVSHPTVYPVVKYYKNKGINIIEAKPKTTFWKLVDKYGWPIGARNTGSNVAVSECCKQLKKEPMKEITEQYNLEFNGVTAFESWTRYCRLKADGLYKFVKSRGKNGRQVCMPIGFWHVEDVWNYINKYNLEYPAVYDQEIDGFTKTGYKEKCKGVEMDRGCIRVGCWPCPLTMKYNDGVMKQLREYYPQMWLALMKKGLAKEVANIKLGGQGSLFSGYFTEETRDKRLENRPCFFDAI